MVARRILIAEGDNLTINSPAFHLDKQDWEIIPAHTPEDVLGLFHEASIVLFEVPADRSRQILEVVQAIRERDQQIPIIFIAVASSERLAIEALRYGVTDYFKWPLKPDEFAHSINRWARRSLPLPSTAPCGDPAPIHGNASTLIGGSPLMEEIKSNIARIAKTDSNVLITGETGTGKELVAELLYKSGSRGDKPFVCINCAAIPDSLLESELFGHEKGSFTGANMSRDGQLKHADNGTVFLDEIGDMGLLGQAKILRAIETKRVQRLGSNGSQAVNVRVIAATNQNLEQKITEGKFRKDLFYRLNVARIHLPSLQERKEDINLLCDHFIQEFNLRFGRTVVALSDETLEYFIRHAWPGNVRELKNVIEATFINEPARQIQVSDLPLWFRLSVSDVQGEESGTDEERDKVLTALLSTNWNKSKAAKRLNWSRMTLYRKMHKYHIADSKLNGHRSTENV